MEIERKFLAKEIPFCLSKYPSVMISQYYISFSPTIRIRQSNKDYFLTVKGKGHIAREEFEIPISEEEYQSLQKKCDMPPIIKTRYFVPLENHLTAEIDIYKGDITGLITIEVEFDTQELAHAFVPPNWFGKDVSLDHRYKNTSLCLYGIPKTI